MDLVLHGAHQQPTQEAEARGSQVQGQLQNKTTSKRKENP